MQNFEHDIEDTIHQYLHRKLTEEQAVEFEDYFVDKPELLSKIESSRAMIQGLHSMKHQSELLSEEVNEVEQAKLLERVFAWLWQPSAGYAVALSALAALIVIPNSHQQTSMDIELLSFSTSSQRNLQAPIETELTRPGTRGAAFIKVAKVDYRQYELELIDVDSQVQVWRSQPFAFSVLNDKMVLMPFDMVATKVALNLYGIDGEGDRKKVDFCHYSEPCAIEY